MADEPEVTEQDWPEPAPEPEEEPSEDWAEGDEPPADEEDK